MVAVMHCTKGFHRALNYNEQKVQEQAAVILDAVNFLKKAEELSFRQKLNLFKRRTQLNEKTTVNCLHISLNFDPSERFGENKLKQIAAAYMAQLGFGEQPYLLYRHDDAGHPHVHVVTTNIKADGSRIALRNIGKVTSEKARKAVEQQFGLLRPEDSKTGERYELKPVNVQKVVYGKSATKRAVTTVLNKVLPEYKYTSLPELNAILKQYNITADRGSKESKIYQKNGLVYRILDNDGNKVGVAIKASDIFRQPTLKNIESRFAGNEALKQPHKGRVINAIDLSLLRSAQPSLPALIKALEREGIATLLRQSDMGKIYGITYVDHVNKVVFNGSDLGKAYSAKGILERCNGQTAQPLLPDGQQELTGRGRTPALVAGSDWADALLKQEFTGDTLPYELRSKKKRKRRRPSGSN